MEDFRLKLDEAFGQRQPSDVNPKTRAPRTPLQKTLDPHKRHPYIEPKLTQQQAFLKMLADSGWAYFGHGGYEGELIPGDNDEFETDCDHCGAAHQVSFKIVKYPTLPPPKSADEFHTDDEFKHAGVSDIEFASPLVIEITGTHLLSDPPREEFNNISSFATYLEDRMAG